jgi:hypothetical protein
MRFHLGPGVVAVTLAAALASACVTALGDFDTGALPDGGDGVDAGPDAEAGATPADRGGRADSADGAPSTDASDGAVVGDGGAIDAGPPFDPTQLAGLSAWLDSDSTTYTLSQARVTGWLDRSAKANSAKNQLPTTSPFPNLANPTFNNRASLHFDGKSYIYVLNSASLQIGDGDFLVAIVASVSPGTTQLETLFEKHDTAAPFAGPALYATPAKADAVIAQGNGVVSQTTGINDGNAHYLAAWRTGATLTVVTDRTQSAGAVTPIAATAGGSKDLQLGMELTGTLQNYLTGDIAEVVVVVGNVSTARAIALRDYMFRKYNL